MVQKGEPIVHIANLQHLDIYGDLPAKYIPQVKNTKKLAISFINFPHTSLQLPISAIEGKINTENQTVGIRLSLNNPNKEYKPGIRVVLQFPNKTHHNTVIIPRNALLEEEGIYSVFVVKGNRTWKRTVKTGIRNNNKIEIVSGIKAGETVATEKAYSLKDGMEVVIR